MKFKETIKKYLFDPLKSSYCVGFLPVKYLSLSKEERFDKVCWVENPKGSWFADPFIYNNTPNNLEVFVEEMQEVKRGG